MKDWSRSRRRDGSFGRPRFKKVRVGDDDDEANGGEGLDLSDGGDDDALGGSGFAAKGRAAFSARGGRRGKKSARGGRGAGTRGKVATGQTMLPTNRVTAKRVNGARQIAAAKAAAAATSAVRATALAEQGRAGLAAGIAAKAAQQLESERERAKKKGTLTIFGSAPTSTVPYRPVKVTATDYYGSGIEHDAENVFGDAAMSAGGFEDNYGRISMGSRLD